MKYNIIPNSKPGSELGSAPQSPNSKLNKRERMSKFKETVEKGKKGN